MAAQGGIPLPGDITAIGGRGNLQDPADRLDPKTVSVRVDEGSHDLKRRSSSAWAKNALANRRISLAFLSSRTSRSSSLDARGFGARRTIALAGIALLVANPAAQCFSGAADLGGDRNDRGPLRLVLILGVKDHAYGALADFWENLVDLLMTPFSQVREPPRKPGLFSPEGRGKPRFAHGRNTSKKTNRWAGMSAHIMACHDTNKNPRSQ